MNDKNEETLIKVLRTPNSRFEHLSGFYYEPYLQAINLVCRDWGGLLGLRLVAENPNAEPNCKAWKVRCQWQKPLLTAFNDSDPVDRGMDRKFQTLTHCAQGPG